jgi:hypothetical protein
MIYGGQFRYRDANWVLGAALVNLEVSRGNDSAGRDAALLKLCNLALRHEFDRIRLLNELARHKSIDIGPIRPQSIMTLKERKDTAIVLEGHCRATGVDLDDEAVKRWRASTESALGITLALPSEPPDSRPAARSVNRWRGAINRGWRGLRRRLGA